MRKKEFPMSIELTVDLDYGYAPSYHVERVNADGSRSPLSNIEVTVDMIKLPFEAKHQQMDSVVARVYRRVLMSLQDAVRNQKNAVHLQEVDFDFLYELLTSFNRWPPMFAYGVPVLIDELERARKENQNRVN